MKRLIKWSYCLAFCLVLGLSNNAWATHYLGNEITYTCLGNHQYQINLTIYTDCASLGYSTAQVQLNSATCGSLTQNLSLVSGSPIEITPSCSSAATNCNGGSIPGYEKYEFSGVVTLTGNCADWIVYYNSCCRSYLGGNLMNSTTQSYYHVAHINDNLPSCNTSASFIEDAPLKFGCVNDTTWIPFGAIDADGDSLVYSLENSWTGNNSSVTYLSGLSGQNPFIGTTAIDGKTGSVMILPTAAQSGYINVKVEEYRNGVKIGEISREVILNFMNCASNSSPSILDMNGQYASNGSYQFTITENSLFNLSALTFDAEVAAGTQSLNSNWSSVPSSATTITGAAPSLSWTPTHQDIGTHLLTLNVQDNACPYYAENTYTIEITVINGGGPTTSFNMDTIAAGATRDICLDLSNLLGALANVTLLTDSLDNATINSVDLSTGCLNITGDSIAVNAITFLLCDVFGNCDTSQLTLDVQEGVWPGDTDLDKGVDNFDLLNIGLGYSTAGPLRANASILWDGYITPDWNKSTPVTQINYKHADCNGDGIINANDTLAIAANWGSSYNYKNRTLGGAGTVPIVIDASAAPSSYNVSLPIHLGSSMLPANDVYGIAFSITYDTSLIKPNTAGVTIGNSWLGTTGTDLISIRKDFYNNGVIQVGVTRIDGLNISGHGIIGSFDFTIQDDIMLVRSGGDTSFNFEIIDVMLIDNSELEIATNPRQSTMVISTNTSTNTQQSILDNQVEVFPNPAHQVLNVRTNDLIINEIQITNLAGQVLKRKQVNSNQTVLEMTTIPNGIYIISIITNEGILNKKINVMK